MAAQKSVQSRRETTRQIKLANPCQEFEVTTRVPEIRRGAVDRQAAIDAVVNEVARLVNADRVAKNKVCLDTNACPQAGETCTQTITDDFERAIVVRRAWVFALPPGAAPGAARVLQFGFRATMPAANIKSACECALIV